MNKWRISAAHIAAACLIVVIATTTGMAAAMIGTPAMLVQHETEHPKANDGHDQLVPTGEATNKLPLIVAPTLDERALFSTKTVRVKIFDLEFGNAVRIPASCSIISVLMTSWSCSVCSIALKTARSVVTWSSNMSRLQCASQHCSKERMTGSLHRRPSDA